MNKYIIDYQYGRAVLYTPSENWEDRFHHLAGQCFGIRKCIGNVRLIVSEKRFPSTPLPFEFERLEHSGDVIVWNKDGKKIKSEWES